MESEININMTDYQAASVNELDRAGVKLSVSDITVLLRIEAIKE